MTVVAFLVLGIYSVSLLYITVYCLLQFNLLYHYQRKPAKAAAPVGTQLAIHREKQRAAPAYATTADGAFDHSVAAEERDAETDLPFVTVQLPIYNEFYVAGRLIDAVAAFDWPRDRFEVHVLDDSTDETVQVIAGKVAEYRKRGFQIRQIRRGNRDGYKAGALRDATPEARGEFIAIFDADFLPATDFLRLTIPHFADPLVGVVQSRWEHLNEDYSLITRLQAMQLNVHFTVEQTGRMNGGHLLQFNGTAGVWRRAAIDAGGGWQPDTLTEDLDLSIRSQLAGYRIQFLEAVASPAELPVEMNSFKSQQHRWMKGGAETARKMLPHVWRSSLGFGHKVHATAHLLASSIFLFVFVCAVFSVPLLFLLGDLAEYGFSKNFFAGFLAGLLSVIGVYYVANVKSPANRDRNFGRSLFRFLGLFPLFLALSMGLSLHNSIAVIQGYRGKRSPFVRTPKFNISSAADKFRTKRYFSGRFNAITVGEGLLAVYFLGAVVSAFYLQNTTFVVFHALLALGYGTIFYYSVKHLRSAQ